MSDTRKLESFDLHSGQVLLVDKPLNWTSFDLVNKVRSIIKCKVGHAGTLDPLATGLVILCTGKFTKRLDSFQAEDKEYTGTIVLGATRPSYDRETDIDQEYDTSEITEEQIRAACAAYTGDIEQMPPIFSAIKIDGEAAYKKARKGKLVEMKRRPITIHEFEVTGIEMPEVHFRVVCSKGTYIRSLAYDIGRALDNGAYLGALRRTRSGEQYAKDAWDIKELSAYLIENKESILQHAPVQNGK